MRTTLTFTDIDQLDIKPAIGSATITFKAKIGAQEAINLVMCNQKGMLIETVDFHFVTEDEPELVNEGKLLVSERP